MMKTSHEAIFGDSRRMSHLADQTVDLIVTSPPYPMIEMWDQAFASMNSEVTIHLNAGNGAAAFETMHQELDKVWRESFRVLKDGGIVCLNIGDAVRTVEGEFRLYSNHSRMIQFLTQLGLAQIPDIIWRKPTNAPNKFMGSGMLPVGAYVTYEHEYILLFRKGERRRFSTSEEKEMRRRSAFFWEERNRWFSDIWGDLPGAGQGLKDKDSRARSGAFPFELAYRLICMFSVYGDTVLDPFLGVGTTLAAAIASCRNSIGIEISRELLPSIIDTANNAPAVGAKRIAERLLDHKDFLRCRADAGKSILHTNSPLDFPVVTKQETDLCLFEHIAVTQISSAPNIRFEACYDLKVSENPTAELSLFNGPDIDP